MGAGILRLMTSTLYDQSFFDNCSPGASRSAEIVIPILMEMLQPQSVIDVGCGRGHWLAVFAQHGLSDYFGVDGAWVELEALDIPRERFVVADLQRPVQLDRRFDLVLSLEVAEHLPASAADGFVQSLAALGNRIVFSAAIPNQGGTGHENEQWPTYWIERFAQHDFEALDVIRPRIWDRDEVEPWYCQNTFLFVRRGTPRPVSTAAAPVDLVHPRHYRKQQTRLQELAILVNPQTMPARYLASWVPAVLWAAVKRRLGLSRAGDRG